MILPPRKSMLLLSAYRAARLRLPNMAQDPRNAVGMMLKERERKDERKKYVYVDTKSVYGTAGQSLLQQYAENSNILGKTAHV